MKERIRRFVEFWRRVGDTTPAQTFTMFVDFWRKVGNMTLADLFNCPCRYCRGRKKLGWHCKEERERK